jgi:hypothetical protein
MFKAHCRLHSDGGFFVLILFSLGLIPYSVPDSVIFSPGKALAATTTAKEVVAPIVLLKDTKLFIKQYI